MFLSFSKVALTPVALVLFAAPAHAEWLAGNNTSEILSDAASVSKKQEGFFGSVSLGYLSNTGNTDSSNLNARASLGYVSAPWRHALLLRAVKGSTDGATTAEEYEVREQSDYTFSDNNYLFGAVNFSTNRFSGYDRRTSEVVGYGRRVLDSDAHTLDLQVGAGARQTRRTDGTRQNEGIVQLAGGYVWNFSETANFSQQIRIESGSDNTFSESITAVTSKLKGNLALSVSYTVKHNSDVSPDLVKTDTATAVSVIYGF